MPSIGTKNVCGLSSVLLILLIRLSSTATEEKESNSCRLPFCKSESRQQLDCSKGFTVHVTEVRYYIHTRRYRPIPPENRAESSCCRYDNNDCQFNITSHTTRIQQVCMGQMMCSIPRVREPIDLDMVTNPCRSHPFYPFAARSILYRCVSSSEIGNRTNGTFVEQSRSIVTMLPEFRMNDTRRSLVVNNESSTDQNDPTDREGDIGAAIGGIIAVLAAVIAMVIVTVTLLRRHRMKSSKAIRAPEENIVAGFQNDQQEGGVYLSLGIDPDYVNTTDDQPYATLGGEGCEAPDYEQCDVSPDFNGINRAVNGFSTNVPPPTDNPSLTDGGTPEYLEFCAVNYENTEYENKTTSPTYCNM